MTTNIDNNQFDEFNLDTSIMDEFEKFEPFYKSPLEYVPFQFIYIDNDGCVSAIQKTNELIENNTISNSKLIYTIKKNTHFKNKKYKLFSILKYSFCDEPEDLLCDLNHYNGKGNLDLITQLENIVFEDTIKSFQDLNNIVIIYYKPHNQKIHSNKKNNYSNTRKIQIYSNKKTHKRAP